MSFESGRKLGLTASLIYVLLPVVAIIGVVVFVVALIASAVSRIGTGTVVPFIGISLGFFVLLFAIIGVSLAGFIMFIIAMHRLSNYYSEPSIFKNVLYAFILSIIAYAFIFALESVFIFSSIDRIFKSSTPSTFVPAFPIFFIFIMIGAVAFGIVNGWLYMRSFNKLKEKSGVDNFGTAGILYLVGTVVPLVGWIAWIFAYLGFRKLQPTSTAAPTISYPNQPAPTSVTMQTKRCPNCGTDNYGDASYCRTCGKSLQ